MTVLLAVRNLYQMFERCYNECVDFKVIDIHIQLHRVSVLKFPFPSPLDREVWFASYSLYVVHTKTIQLVVGENGGYLYHFASRLGRYNFYYSLPVWAIFVY